MIFKQLHWRLAARVLLLFGTLVAAAFLLVKGHYLSLAALFPLVIYLVIELMRFQQKIQDEVAQFLEGVQYRDFSRHFDVKQAPAHVRQLRKGFNDINATFKLISKEKETQYQYLQKILELVDTGILSYETESGTVVWMNESLKKLLHLPYLKTVHSLEKRNSPLFEEINSLQPGQHKVVTAQLEKSSARMLLSATAFSTEGKLYKLIAFQNVAEALDENESEAWQKLLGVLTHEIMNSVAPISSLAGTLQSRLSESAAALAGNNIVIEDLELGIDTIKKRSEGLLKFAETYRSLNKITKLNLTKVYVDELFYNLKQLMLPMVKQKGIELEIVLHDEELTFHADQSLIEQVLINLVVNAIDAVKERPAPKIVLSAEQTAPRRLTLKVTDNGGGMTREVADKIFIPFFSTKKTGSGIGLSLCKQIMLMHKGNIKVQSAEGKGSVFLLGFN